ncbi:MAG: FtsX-like permease family protein, partial [Myxococcota bacterium]
AATRQKEMAIRSALGATRPQIVLQLLTEAAMLALVALPFALLVTNWTIQGLLSQVPPSVTYMEQFFRFDPPVWIFCAVITLSTVVFFGLAPALQASRPDLNTSLKEGGERGSSHAGRQRLRFALVVGQIALALALLVSSGLMIESFMNLQTADPGFETEHLVVTQLNLPEARYTEPDHHRAFQRDVLQRIRRLPGVKDVGTTQDAPFGFGGRGVEFQVRGRAQPSDAEIPRANWTNVSPNYHALMGIPLARGRALERADGEGGRPVIVINETLARRYFADEYPIGEHLVFKLDPDGEEIEHEIVGVARDIINWGFNEEKWPRIYAPFVQAPTAFMNVVVRTRGAPLEAVPALRAEFASIDPNLALFQFESMTDRMQRSKWQQRLFAVIMISLGTLALVLASVGVYGVVSYSTAQRTREFGIRSALGAAPSGIAGLVLREALVLAGLGLALGALLGAGMARLLQALLYEISPWRPITFLVVAVLLAAVALVASVVPARRATRVDPMIALRVE